MTFVNIYIEIIVNSGRGSFIISEKRIKLYCDKLGFDSTLFRYDLIKRHDTTLIKYFEELGCEFNDGYGCIEIVKIPKEFFNYYRLCNIYGRKRIYYDYETYDKDHSNIDDNSIKVLLNCCYEGWY